MRRSRMPDAARRIAAALALGLAATAITPASLAPAGAAGAHRAAVIVDTGTEVHRVLITFDEPSITGIEALVRADASPVVRGSSRLLSAGR